MAKTKAELSDMLARAGLVVEGNESKEELQEAWRNIVETLRRETLKGVSRDSYSAA